MQPERKTKIGGLLIEEYYWNGKMVCSVNHRSSEKTYDEEVSKRSQK